MAIKGTCSSATLTKEMKETVAAIKKQATRRKQTNQMLGKERAQVTSNPVS